MYQLIFTHGGGRLGNQLLNHAHFLALLEEYPHQFNLCNVMFSRYADDYLGKNHAATVYCSSNTLVSTTARYLWTDLPLEDDRVRKVLDRVAAWMLHGLAHWGRGTQSLLTEADLYAHIAGKRFEMLNFDDPEQVEWLRAQSVSVLAGWNFRGWRLLQKHQNAVRQKLEPAASYQRVAERYFRPLRRQYDRIAGVMIRQGDYRQWNEATYFFEPTQYARWMTAFDQRYPDEEVAFVVASDEEQDPGLFEGVDCFFTTGIAGGGGHYMESFVELSGCDVVMTPPSTFSTLAAFIGEAALLPLYPGCDAATEPLLVEHVFDARSHSHLGLSVH